jgi:hypothetical protein
MDRTEAEVQQALGLGMEARDSIIGESNFKESAYFAGIRHFENLALAQLTELIELEFCDPTGRQNDSPTTGQFCKFMERFPFIRAHGYTVHRDREDYRMTIEGLHFDGTPSKKQAITFRKFCKSADNLPCCNGLYSWWD